jgi:hypothetical protein
MSHDQRSTGEITDSDEPSTVWKKIFKASLNTISEICSGNSMAVVRPGMKGSMSVLELEQHRACLEIQRKYPHLSDNFYLCWQGG